MSEMSTNQKALIILWVYVKIMFFAFTGGNVTLSLLQRELDDRYHLMNRDDVLECFALGQSLPGVISLSAGIMIGRKIAGLKGIVAAFFGVVLPAFIGMIFITVFFQQLKKISFIQGAINGIRISSVAIIFFNAINIIRSSVKDKFGILIVLVAFLCTFFFEGSVMFVIIGCGIAGIIYASYKKEVKS